MLSMNERWIFETQLPNAVATLVCFPSAGSEPTLFRDLPIIDAPINKCVAQLPGKGSRRNECLLTNIDDIVDDLFTQIGELPDLPLVFWGHSMGAWVAYRLAEKMKQAGHHMPVHIVISASLPMTLKREPPFVHTMSTYELAVELKCLGGTPDVIIKDFEFLEVFKPSIQADFKAFETYQHNFIKPLDIPFSLWIAHDDPRIPMNVASQWNRLFVEEPNRSIFGGGHMFILQDFNSERIASHFKDIFLDCSKIRESHHECA